MLSPDNRLVLWYSHFNLERTMKKIMLLFAGFMFIASAGYADRPSEEPDIQKARHHMVKTTIQDRGIKDTRVLAAMQAVPRHRFVPDRLLSAAYADRPLPIGEGQTISQPYVVALMTEILGLQSDQRVLEIGTGSGYQAAVLAEVTRRVYTIEIKEKLHVRSSKLLKSLGYNNISTRHSDGYFGWPEAAPFDAIMITAAIDHVPPPLLKQLKDGGRLALPLGNPFSYQNLVLVTKKGDDLIVKQITGVLFVPMTGHALKKPAP
jgi:protein-L-isoaspartate(D-aspartate) O-methyltransferase